MKNFKKKIKQLFQKIIKKIRKIQQPLIKWINGLPFILKFSIGFFCGILGIIGIINPLIPAWFFLPVAGQILFFQRKKIIRRTIGFKQKTVRIMFKKRKKIIRKTKKLEKNSLNKQYIYKKKIYNILCMNNDS